MEISVIIPTYQAARYLPALLSKLWSQSVQPTEIIVVDSSSTDGSRDVAREYGCQVEVIQKSVFNHGSTRNLAASLAHGDILVFLTQDALPIDTHFLRELVQPLREGKAQAAYGRQIPYADAPPPEAFARTVNYPAISHLRTQADISRMGIKAFFFSNVASCVRSDVFQTVHGFPEAMILNEDMALCAKLLREGAVIAYQADAKVFHSHTYRLNQQFSRYFDIGVATAQAGQLLKGARAGGEGFKFALRQIHYLLQSGAWVWIPRTLVEIGFKYIAYQLGKRERFLAASVKRRLSMHDFFWKRSAER